MALLTTVGLFEFLWVRPNDGRAESPHRPHHTPRSHTALRYHFSFPMEHYTLPCYNKRDRLSCQQCRGSLGRLAIRTRPNLSWLACSPSARRQEPPISPPSMATFYDVFRRRRCELETSGNVIFLPILQTRRSGWPRRRRPLAGCVFVEGRIDYCEFADGADVVIVGLTNTENQSETT